MRLVAVLICLAIAIAGSSASDPLPLPPHLRSHPAFTKDRWAHTGAAPADHPHTITLALKQRNLDKLHALFEAVSDPQSPTYAQYLSREELRDIVQPPRSAQRAIERWLQAHNASKIDFLVTRDAVRATVPIASVNRMFSVEMREFRHADGRTLYRSLQPHRVPSRIARHVQLVLGVSTFPVPSNRKRSLRETVPLSRRAHKPHAPLRPESIVGKPVLDEVAARVQFAVSFHPQCADGSVPKSLPLCQQAPPAPNALYIQAWPANDNSEAQPITTTLAFDSSACSVDSSIVSCRVTTSSSWLPLYTPMNVSVALFFGDGVGPSVVNPFPIVRTPPVTPQGLSKLYNIPANTLVTNASNTQCVVEFEQQYFTQSDLALFMSAMGLPAPAPVPVIGPNPGPAGGEANLDIQWIMGLAPGAPTTFWSIFSNSSVEIDDILQWEFAIGNATTPPLVNSVSYGMTSSAVDQFLGAGYLARSDVEFQKLSLRGITILIASGDTGAGDLGAPPMSAPNCTTLNPDWPSQSPYVLSVGSTLITPNALPICYLPAALGGIDCSNNPLGEATVSLEQGLFWTGGGGFSAETSQPGYQATAVNGYLTQARALGLLPPSSMWNSSNRGYPDVAAVGHNLMVALGGQFIPVDGTSASAPIFGGILTLLNDVRLNNNLPPLGFVNPLLYQIAKDTPAAFYDVTVGSNRCGAYGWSPLCCDSAFHALPGWDPTAGLGTPNFEVLREAVLKAPRWVNQRHSFRA